MLEARFPLSHNAFDQWQKEHRHTFPSYTYSIPHPQWKGIAFRIRGGLPKINLSSRTFVHIPGEWDGLQGECSCNQYPSSVPQVYERDPEDSARYLPLSKKEHGHCTIHWQEIPDQICNRLTFQSTLRLPLWQAFSLSRSSPYHCRTRGNM